MREIISFLFVFGNHVDFMISFNFLLYIIKYLHVGQ
jgi:hypothetical protein